jgi:hypothetical protein
VRPGRKDKRFGRFLSGVHDLDASLAVPFPAIVGVELEKPVCLFPSDGASDRQSQDVVNLIRGSF